MAASDDDDDDDDDDDNDDDDDDDDDDDEDDEAEDEEEEDDAVIRVPHAIPLGPTAKLAFPAVGGANPSTRFNAANNSASPSGNLLFRSFADVRARGACMCGVSHPECRGTRVMRKIFMTRTARSTPVL